VHVQAVTDLADTGIDELEVLGVAEPARELGGDRFGACPLSGPPGEQRAEPDVGGERVPRRAKSWAAAPSRNDPVWANCGAAVAALC